MPFKADVNQLKEEDPEFYQFLLDNDKELLTSDESDMSEEEEMETKVTIKQQMKNLGPQTIKSITKTFKKCFEDGDFNLDSTESFEELTNCVFVDCVAFIKNELNLENIFSNYSSHKKYFKYKNAIKNIVSCFIHFLESQPCDQSLEDEHTIENPLMVVVLSQSSHVIQLAYAFPALLKKIIKQSALIFGKSRSIMMKAKGLAVVKLVVHARSGRDLYNDTKSVDKNLLELAIKLLYKTYLEHSRQVHENNLTMISFMSQSIVSELCGIDLETTYSLAYQFLRQIANLTRLAYDNKIEKKVHHVYGWSCLQAMRLWSQFICKYAIKSATLLNAIKSINDKRVIHSKVGNQANMLIYPYVQLCHAILQLQPTPRYFPFKFHLLALMIDINQSTDTMVPVMHYLVEVVQSIQQCKNPTVKAIEFNTTIRASKQHLSTQSYQESLVEKCHDLFIKAIAVHSNKIYFPDWICPMQKILRQLLQKSTNKKSKQMLQHVLKSIEQSKQSMLEKRKSVKFGPCDLDLILQFESNLPKDTPMEKLVENISNIEARVVPVVNAEEVAKSNRDEIMKDKVEPLALSDDESPSVIPVKRTKMNKKQKRVKQ